MMTLGYDKCRASAINCKGLGEALGGDGALTNVKDAASCAKFVQELPENQVSLILAFVQAYSDGGCGSAYNAAWEHAKSM